MVESEVSALSKKDNVKYNIYNSKDELVATIHDKSHDNIVDMSLEVFTDNSKNLPFLLQEEVLESEWLVKFLKSRVLSNRPSIEQELKNKGVEYSWQNLIKLNSGRSLEDDFYILTSENEVETKKSTKSCIVESKETLSEKPEEPEIIENLQDASLSDKL